MPQQVWQGALTLEGTLHAEGLLNCWIAGRRAVCKAGPCGHAVLVGGDRPLSEFSRHPNWVPSCIWFLARASSAFYHHFSSSSQTKFLPHAIHSPPPAPVKFNSQRLHIVTNHHAAQGYELWYGTNAQQDYGGVGCPTPVMATTVVSLGSTVYQTPLRLHSSPCSIHGGRCLMYVLVVVVPS